MDFYGVQRGTIRSHAYKKLAQLSVSNTSVVITERSEKVLFATIDKKKSSNLSDVAISLNEFEILVALCEATSKSFASVEQAKTLVKKFRIYLLELPQQQFSDAVFVKLGETPPWLILAQKLTSALINLFWELNDSSTCDVINILTEFIQRLFIVSNLEVSSYLTLFGFLKALSRAPGFLVAKEEAFKIFTSLNTHIDNGDFLTGVEYYSTYLASYPKPRMFFENYFVVNFSPMLLLQTLSILMVSLVSEISQNRNQEKDLMTHLLEVVSTDKHFSRSSDNGIHKTTHQRKISGISNGNGSSMMESLVSEVDDLHIEDDGASSLNISSVHLDYLRILSDAAVKKVELLDEGENFIVYSSMHRLELGYATKSKLISVIACGVLTDMIDVEVAKNVFNSAIRIQKVMLDPCLGTAIIQLGSLLVFKDLTVSSSLTRAFTTLVTNPSLSPVECLAVSKSVGIASRVLSQDNVVTTIYALTNMIFVGDDPLQLKARSRRVASLLDRATSFSSESRSQSSANPKPNQSIKNKTLSDQSSFTGNEHEPEHELEPESESEPEPRFNEEEYVKICQNAVAAISEIVAACDDESVSTLAVAILFQKKGKLNSTLAPSLLEGMVSCAPFLPEIEFVMLVKGLHNLSMESFQAKNDDLLEFITEARINLAKKLNPEHPLHKVYLAETLLAIVSHGDVQELDQHRSHSEISAIGVHISLHLKPLAQLLPNALLGEKPLLIDDSQIANLFRSIWFNMVVHGYSINSVHAEKYAHELEVIAYSTPPLASELSWNRTETSLELNTVLKRGSSNHNVKDHKQIVGGVIEIPRGLSYSKLMFLAAALFVESLRVKSGDCHTVLKYFSDPSMKTSGIEKYLVPIALRINENYTGLIDTGGNKQFSAYHIAEQLTFMLTLCCHAHMDLKEAAFQCCDMLVTKVPSSLCHHKSLFALFDLLTLLYDSVVDSEVNQYNPKFLFIAEKTGVQLRLPDSYRWRNETFTRLHKKAKFWVEFLLLRCNYDTKSLIQSYVSEAEDFQSASTIRFGVSFALEMAGTIAATDRELSHLPQVVKGSSFNLLPPVISQLSWKSNSVSDIVDRVSFGSLESSEMALQNLRSRVDSFKSLISGTEDQVSVVDVIELLSEIAGFILAQDANLAELVRYLVGIPFAAFESSSMSSATAIWGAVMKEKPQLSVLVLSEVTKNWEFSIKSKEGVFSRAFDLRPPEFSRMEYSPSDFKSVSKLAMSVDKYFQPHSEIIKVLSSNFEATMNQSDHLLKMFTDFVDFGLQNLRHASLHPFARHVRFELIRFALDILSYHTRLGSRSCEQLTESIIDSALSWFIVRASYPFGSNLLKIKADYTLMKEIADFISQLYSYKSHNLEQKKILLMIFMDDEISKIDVWLNPSRSSDTRGSYMNTHLNSDHVKLAYSIDPQLAINLANRFKMKNLDEVLQRLITETPVAAMQYPEAVQYLIGFNTGARMPLHHLLFWEPLSPIDAINLFLPPFGSNSYILQYTMRSLEHHDVNLTFFYVPQIVQSVRYDSKGYVQRFIVETAHVSGLFAHQIVWNMLANSYKDEEATMPDSIKPSLDAIQKLMLANFSEEDLSFYRKEFEFFDEVTSISGKLKPYIKKSKAEKKVKIDEEMSRIVVRPGVYLPSNPDGVLVDINRKSGKPLQSHAKAPFMATFKIKKDVEEVDELGKVHTVEIEKWQSAIFKVGDDCRQDVLALQLISVFRTVWLNAGLDLYVFPYRVTATAPGCGVIDVLPNSTSRDMLGREAVNGLYEYYTTKFGPETSIEFQQARNNLVRSLAAYSVISYILQFKDRHNGNIMYDDRGHILHIDFGFCFDIVPGGVKFEVAPFKLTKEMVLVLGGSDHTQAYQWFEDLCIKGFLACRPYMETIVRCVTPMLESGLPCFKETTIKKLRKRFAPDRTEREAAQYFKGLIKKSYESFYTTGYDEFQRLTNGIPY